LIVRRAARSGRVTAILAGFLKLQRAWRVLDESRVLSRFEAFGSGATPAGRQGRRDRTAAGRLEPRQRSAQLRSSWFRATLH
jgi:hypothetical protein